MMSTPDSHPPIPPGPVPESHSPMDIRDIRRNNLAALVKTSGGNKPLADRIDTDPAYTANC